MMHATVRLAYTPNNKDTVYALPFTGGNAVNIEDQPLFQVCEGNKYIDDIQMEIPANVLGNDEFEVTHLESLCMELNGTMTQSQLENWS